MTTSTPTPTPTPTPTSTSTSTPTSTSTSTSTSTPTSTPTSTATSTSTPTPTPTPISRSPLRGLANVRLHARDLAAARAWYAELLGGPPYFERPGYVEFRTGDDASELGILDAALVGHLGGHGLAAAPCGAVAYWHVDDVSAALARVVALGAVVHEPPRDFGGGFVVASARDPFANVLGLMHSPHWVAVRGLGAAP